MIKPTKRKGFNFYRSYYDVFNELSDKDKLVFIKALLDKQFLDVEPKDLSGMVKFAWISQYNSIDQQVKGYKSKTKDLMITPTVGGSTRVDLPPTLQEEGKGEGKGEGKEKEEYTKAAALPFSFYNSLIKLGGEKQLVSDWLEVRKNKNATNSKTAFNGFKKQLEKTNSDINKILTLCVEKSWAGFKAEWFENEQPKKTSQKATFNNPII